MSSDKDKDPQAYDDELPQHTETLPAFQIARYPVTYAQYTPFVEGDGYTNGDYWTPDGLKWHGNKRQPEYAWKNPQWHITNHPVVGVT